MMQDNATFLIDRKRLTQAKLYVPFKSEGLKLTLKFLMFIGFFSITTYFIVFFVPDLNEFSLIYEPLTFLGLLAFLIFIFGVGYLSDSEKAIETLETYTGASYIPVMRYEACLAFDGNNAQAFDLRKLLNGLLKTQRVNFILNEITVSEEALSSLVPDVYNGNEALHKILINAKENAQSSGSELISSGDIFFGLVKNSPNYENFLRILELDEDDFKTVVFWQNKVFDQVFNKKTLIERLSIRRPGIAQDWGSGYTNFLNHFSVDLGNTEEFSLQGREEIYREIENILTKTTKNNVILVGETGSGKSTLVTGLASRIYRGKSLPSLNYFRVVKLDTSALISVAANRSELENVVVGILNDAVRAGNVILFVDDIHTLFAGGEKEGTVDISEIISPYLENSGIRFIGATTQRNYETYIAAKNTIAGNFTKIEVAPTNKNSTMRVLTELGLFIGARYKTTISYSGIKEVYRLASRFVSEKEMPGRAVDLLENLCSAAKNSGKSFLDKNVIDLLSQHDLNIPVAEAVGEEKVKLLKLEEKIHSRVIGQEEAVSAISDALRRARAQISEQQRPIGTFLFLGPTGVGKTELSKALAWAYFGSEDAMVRLDMNEYQEAGAGERLIGKKITGREELEGGNLVKEIKEKPFSVLLLDEIEKAHQDVQDLLLQMLDEGYIKNGMGEKVLFTNAIVIATSNAAANLIREGAAHGEDFSKLKNKVIEEIIKKSVFKPEFINRFDGIVLFKPLSEANLLKIGELMFENITEDFSKKGYKINLGEGLLEKLVKEGYQPEMGARPLRRVFQDRLGSYLAKAILSDKIKKGEAFTVKLEDIY